MNMMKIWLVSLAVVLVTLTVVAGQKKCKRQKTFTYTVVNELKEPFFNETTVLNLFCKRKTPLIRYMEQSVLDFPDQFTGFIVTFSSPYGYYVDSMNGRIAVYSEDQTYWSIWNKGAYLPKGVSTYLPRPGDQILFNLTQYIG